MLTVWQQIQAEIKS